MTERALKTSVAVAFCMLVAACGGSGGGQARTGGTVTILDTAGGVDSLDPGYWYYGPDYTELGNTTQRWLYGWKPDETKPMPDLAEALPKISDAGRTLTIKIRPHINYSAPLQNRAVAAADIKYALERCFLPQVANGYAPVYYGDIEGVKQFQSGDAGNISGIRTPDDRTLVIKTTKPTGVLSSARALGMPCTVPVPRDYAKRYDKGKISTYGAHQVFTGPYMIENDGKGKITGYEAGRKLTLVRNPSWRKSSDFKPAHFDRIEIKGGFDTFVASRKTLTGHSLLSGDYLSPPPAVLKSALSSRKSQLAITPSGGSRFISLNTKIKPLANADLRRAISAAIDRTALRQTIGGPTIGTIATHHIPPGIVGFDEAGGEKGPGFDFASSPTANIPLAQKYLRKAGFKSGRYEGPPLLTIADAESPASKTAEAFQEQVGKIGIKLQFHEVPHATMQSKFCTVPKAAVAICPSLTWGADFFASQSFIDPLFNGASIVPSGNANTSQVNDPQLNARITAAKEIVDPAASAKAWAELDKDVTGGAYLIPWLWDNNVGLHSANLKGVPSKFSGGAWDLTFSSLK
jgi:peptide/nickel transport system substrate-binding protein